MTSCLIVRDEFYTTWGSICSDTRTPYLSRPPLIWATDGPNKGGQDRQSAWHVVATVALPFMSKPLSVVEQALSYGTSFMFRPLSCLQNRD